MSAKTRITLSLSRRHFRSFLLFFFFFNDTATTEIYTLSLHDALPIAVGLLETLAEVFAGREPDTTEENLQARIRGVLLMALSNKFGWLVVATGNKSELSVGYATLYGDMTGGFALLKDVFKT